MDYSSLSSKLKDFSHIRDWDQFHNTKDLAMALSIESGELLELFLWQDISELDSLLVKKREKIEDEVADIFLYLVRFCQKADIDLEAVSLRKLEKNAKKYPAELVKGQKKKYDEY